MLRPARDEDAAADALRLAGADIRDKRDDGGPVFIPSAQA